MSEQPKRLRLFSFAAVMTGTIFVLAVAVLVASLLAADAAKEEPKKDAAKTAEPSTTSKDKEAEQKEADKKDTAKKDADKKEADKKDSAKPAKAKDKKAEDEEIEPADNSYCIVCHLNYETEKLSRSHQIAGVGCDKCHGASEKHSGDEDGLTAPDVIFAHEEVDKFCMTCHPKEKIAKSENHKELFKPAEKAAAEPTDKPVDKAKAKSSDKANDKAIDKAIDKAEGKVDDKAEEHLVCTECHGENHKMAVRTRKWDKKTRKLLSDDGVRMMYKDSPATEGVPEGKKKP
jgi:UDP-2,3-diacylglucosamine pyrophosphatase LpxH